MNKAIRPGLLCSLILILLALAATEADTETDHAESSSSGSKGLSVDSLSAVVFSADGKKQSSNEGKLGDKLLKKVQLKAGESVEVSFQPLLGGAAAKVQQAMLMAVSKEQPSLAAYAVAKAKKDGMHVITLAVAGMEKQLGSLGGAFDVTLLLGDPSASKGLAAPLGSLLLPEGGEAKPKLLTAASQAVNNIKPNIHHTFRPPTKGAPAVVSLAFTGLAVAPLAVLLVYLGALGVNLKALPTGSASLWVMLFHGGIAAMLGLYLLFWVHLNLATTLPLAMLLGLFIAGSGYKALGALSAARIADSKAMTSGKKTN